MGGAVGIIPSKIEQRRVEIAAIERAQEIVPAGDQMRDVVDQLSVSERHQNRVSQRSAFDADAQGSQVTDAGNAAVARLRAEDDGQWGIDIRFAWREHAERDAAPAIVARGALEIREFCGL